MKPFVINDYIFDDCAAEFPVLHADYKVFTYSYGNIVFLGFAKPDDVILLVCINASAGVVYIHCTEQLSAIAHSDSAVQYWKRLEFACFYGKSLVQAAAHSGYSASPHIAAQTYIALSEPDAYSAHACRIYKAARKLVIRNSVFRT